MNYFLSGYYTIRAILFYVGSVLVVALSFIQNVLPLEWVISGLVEVIFFFAGAHLLTRKWSDLEDNRYVKRLFVLSFFIRLCWVVAGYYLYLSLTGKPFEFSAADSLNYHTMAGWLSSVTVKDGWNILMARSAGAVSDVGYPFYLSLLYSMAGSEVMIPRLIKAVFSAISVVLVYRLAQRNFGEDIGRMAGIYSMLMPNLIYYNGLHLKETEMVFLVLLFMDQADRLLRSRKFNFIRLFFLLITVVLLFSFRTVLGITALFSVVTAVVVPAERVSKSVNRWLLAAWMGVALAFVAGSRIAGEVEQLWASRMTNQQRSYEWRSTREQGNSLARYATSAYLAPAIFIIPLPTMVNVETQQNQMLLHGGYYVKNVMSFFVLMALLGMVAHKKWRHHVLLLSFTIAYLMIVAFSSFAHSERFHLPVLPLLLILAACGTGDIKPSQKQFYVPYLVLVTLAIVAWSWFKLAGRGLV